MALSSLLSGSRHLAFALRSRGSGSAAKLLRQSERFSSEKVPSENIIKVSKMLSGIPFLKSIDPAMMQKVLDPIGSRLKSPFARDATVIMILIPSALLGGYLLFGSKEPSNSKPESITQMVSNKTMGTKTSPVVNLMRSNTPALVSNRQNPENTDTVESPGQPCVPNSEPCSDDVQMSSANPCIEDEDEKILPPEMISAIKSPQEFKSESADPDNSPRKSKLYRKSSKLPNEEA